MINNNSNKILKDSLEDEDDEEDNMCTVYSDVDDDEDISSVSKYQGKIETVKAH
jgi:hypothetical protein